MSTVRAILVNPIYTGSMVWNRRRFGKFHRIANQRATPRPRQHLGRGGLNRERDWIVTPDSHEPIISKDVFAAARALRESREKNPRLNAGRGGRAKSSPFLLSGLIKCTDCGHNFQGYRVRRGRRKGQGRVETHYYCCGGYITKGNAVCKRHLVSRAAFEDYVLGRIGSRLELFLRDSGRKLLERMIREELGPEPASGQEGKQIRARLDEIRTKIDTLIDSLTPTNKEFVDEKLSALKTEKERLEGRLATLDTPRPRVDVKAIVGAGIEKLGRLRELLDHGSTEEQKTLVRAFLARIELSSKDGSGAAYFYRLPTTCSFELVAGARYEPVQISLALPERFVAGLRSVA